MREERRHSSTAGSNHETDKEKVQEDLEEKKEEAENRSDGE